MSANPEGLVAEIREALNWYATVLTSTDADLDAVQKARRHFNTKLQALCDRLEASERQREAYREALTKIEEGKGPFSRDRITHAENAIEAMKSLARAVLSSPEGATKGEG